MHINSHTTIYYPVLSQILFLFSLHLILLSTNSCDGLILCSWVKPLLPRSCSHSSHLNQFSPAQPIHQVTSFKSIYLLHLSVGPHFTFSSLQYRPQLPVASLRFSATQTSECDTGALSGNPIEYWMHFYSTVLPPKIYFVKTTSFGHF